MAINSVSRIFIRRIFLRDVRIYPTPIIIPVRLVECQIEINEKINIMSELLHMIIFIDNRRSARYKNWV